MSFLDRIYQRNPRADAPPPPSEPGELPSPADCLSTEKLREMWDELQLGRKDELDALATRKRAEAVAAVKAWDAANRAYVERFLSFDEFTQSTPASLSALSRPYRFSESLDKLVPLLKARGELFARVRDYPPPEVQRLKDFIKRAEKYWTEGMDVNLRTRHPREVGQARMLIVQAQQLLSTVLRYVEPAEACDDLRQQLEEKLARIQHAIETAPPPRTPTDQEILSGRPYGLPPEAEARPTPLQLAAYQRSLQ
jgi:hypothetical protein